jgi:Carbohydrate family 9 binding domain-like/Secretion system C-terminal sorting domain
VEVYIDAENNGGTSYGANDRQFVKVYNSTTLSEIHNNTTGILHGWSAITGGYAVELAIPWSSIGITPSASMTIGFDVGVNDDDNGGARDAQQMWQGDANNWQYTHGFGDLILSATTTGGGARIAAPAQLPEMISNEVIIYPNPVNAQILKMRLQAQEKSKARITIFNVTSQKVIDRERQLQKGNNMIEVSTKVLKSGVYLIVIDKGSERIMKKVIVN